jgi:omega-hydroxy-beta-dihydromenaquinone-9 sulfotransferase
VIEAPIFIVGTGRCGSTLLHRILARHPETGWLSTFNEVLPGQTWLSAFSNLYRTPLPERLRHARAFPKPFECYRFWEHYLPGFSRRDRPLTPADVPEHGIVPVRRAVSQVLRAQRRPRFVGKVTGWSRIGYLNRIFPDARFIVLKREHRAVVSSWAQAGWLDVTSDLDSEHWQWGEVPARYRRLWQELGGGPTLSAAVKVQLDLDDIERNVQHVPDRCLEQRFEELISRPRESLRALTEFGGLGWSDGWDAEVSRLRFDDPTGKWKRYLTEEEGGRLLEFFARAGTGKVPLPQ